MKKYLKAPMYATTILLVIVPLIYLVFISFMTRSEVWGYDVAFTLENYRNLMKPLYLSVFWDSIKLGVIATFFIALVGYPFGYFMARQTSRWKKSLTVLLMIPFWISGVIRLYGWVIMFRSNGVLDKILMSVGLIDEPLKLLYSYSAVVVGMVYALVPFMIFSVYQSVEKVDFRYVSAARDLGASSINAFLTITLPMTMPGLLSGVILSFIPSMGLFFIADILGGNKIVLVGNLISDLMTTGKNVPLAAAMSVVLLAFTYVSIVIYKKVTKSDDLQEVFR